MTVEYGLRCRSQPPHGGTRRSALAESFRTLIGRLRRGDSNSPNSWPEAQNLRGAHGTILALRSGESSSFRRCKKASARGPRMRAQRMPGSQVLTEPTGLVAVARNAPRSLDFIDVRRRNSPGALAARRELTATRRVRVQAVPYTSPVAKIACRRS